jgi:nucleoside-diphosphate-sugar epimerase
VGREVARQLRQAGHDVVALARNLDRAGDLRTLGVDVRPGDIADRESMRAPMASADGVFHIAGWYKIGTKDKAEGTRINVDGTRNVLSLMKELGIPKGVYTSTLAVNSDTRGKLADESYRFTGTHLSEYDRTKAAAHDLAAAMIQAGLPLVIVQPGVVYGPGDQGPIHDTFQLYLKRKLPMLVQETAYAWGYIDDIAQAHLLAMDKGRLGQSYFTCGPVHRLVDVMRLAERVSGVPAPKLVVPSGLVQAMSALTGLVDGALTLPPLYTSEFLRVSTATYVARNDKARRELDWVPRSLEEGLPLALRWEMAQLGLALPR